MGTQQYGDVSHIDPKHFGKVFGADLNIKDHKLMVWSIHDAFLNGGRSVNKIWMIFGPQSSVVFPIDLNELSIRPLVEHILEDILNAVVKLFDHVPGIKKLLCEISGRVFTRDWNFLGEEVIPSPISDLFGS